jgi:hypothetical protein
MSGNSVRRQQSRYKPITLHIPDYSMTNIRWTVGRIKGAEGKCKKKKDFFAIWQE